MKQNYKIPKGYMPWNRFAGHASNLSLLRGQKLTTENLPSLHNLAYEFQAWLHGYPLYCVRQSLLEDMLDTDVGENLALFSNIQLPIPCYLLFFPQQQVRSPGKKGWMEVGTYAPVVLVNSDCANMRDLGNP